MRFLQVSRAGGRGVQIKEDHNFHSLPGSRDAAATVGVGLSNRGIPTTKGVLFEVSRTFNAGLMVQNPVTDCCPTAGDIRSFR